MLVYLVCEELFSPYKKDTLVYDRFVSLLQDQSVDAVLIANATDRFHNEIAVFKASFGSLVSRVVESETPVKIENERFHLRSSALVTHQNEIIHAVDDSVCEIVVHADGTYDYQYLALDLFDTDHVEVLEKQRKPRQIIVPFQDILKFLEQNMDEETAELLKKAKADFYYKTKS